MFTTSVSILIAVNLVPLIGVLFLKWSIGSIMFIYWSENIVIGIYNALKMAQARGEGRPEKSADGSMEMPSRWGMITFFLVHYGFFTFGHGAFVLVIFKKSNPSIGVVFPIFILLFISHGISYWKNFLKGGEYKRVSCQKLFSQPYTRIFIMHITIIAAGFSIQEMGSPLPALALMIILKTGIDVKSHKRERKKFGTIGRVQ